VTDEQYLARARDLPKRSLVDLGCRVLDEEDRGQGVARWNFILDGPRVLVTSSSGMYLRSHNHHLAIGEALDDVDGGRSGHVFISCLRIKTYASGGRDGYLVTLYRGGSLNEALRAINNSFQEWRWGEHGIERQPSGQIELERSNFDRAFRKHPDSPGESDERTDALAQEFYLPSTPPLPSNEPMRLRVIPSRAPGRQANETKMRPRSRGNLRTGEESSGTPDPDLVPAFGSAIGRTRRL
jgi:hypothetical protein